MIQITNTYRLLIGIAVAIFLFIAISRFLGNFVYKLIKITEHKKFLRSVNDSIPTNDIVGEFRYKFHSLINLMDLCPRDEVLISLFKEYIDIISQRIKYYGLQSDANVTGLRCLLENLGYTKYEYKKVSILAEKNKKHADLLDFYNWAYKDRDFVFLDGYSGMSFREKYPVIFMVSVFKTLYKDLLACGEYLNWPLRLLECKTGMRDVFSKYMNKSLEECKFSLNDLKFLEKELRKHFWTEDYFVKIRERIQLFEKKVTELAKEV